MSNFILVKSCCVSAGYTCSAGIACNKLMAKIASAMHKPNQQTVIPPRYWHDWRSDAIRPRGSERHSHMTVQHVDTRHVTGQASQNNHMTVSTRCSVM